MSLTRVQVAGIALRSLGQLGNSLRLTEKADQSEGDLTDAIDMAMRDCGFATIADCDTQGKERALILGATYYILLRVYRDRAAELTSQQGAGAAGMHLSIDPSTSLGSLRLHISEALGTYKDALNAIGKTMATDPSAGRAAPVVFVTDDDEQSMSLVVGDQKLPWFEEGYTEVR